MTTPQKTRVQDAQGWRTAPYSRNFPDGETVAFAMNPATGFLEGEVSDANVGFFSARAKRYKIGNLGEAQNDELWEVNHPADLAERLDKLIANDAKYAAATIRAKMETGTLSKRMLKVAEARVIIAENKAGIAPPAAQKSGNKKQSEKQKKALAAAHGKFINALAAYNADKTIGGKPDDIQAAVQNAAAEYEAERAKQKSAFLDGGEKAEDFLPNGTYYVEGVGDASPGQ